MLEISNFLTRQFTAELGIRPRHRLKRDEVSHEVSGGDTGGVRGPPRAIKGPLQVSEMGDLEFERNTEWIGRIHKETCDGP